MPDSVIENVLNGKLDSALLIKWLNDESIEDAPDDCVLLCSTKSDFVAYFLTYLRNQTDSILQTNSNVQLLQNATPDKLLARKHHRSASEPTSDENTVKTDSKSQSPNRDRKTHESPNQKKTGRRVKTKLFTENNSNVSSDESRISLGVDRIQLSSTPLKNGLKPEFPLTSPVTPKNNYERCDTPRFNHRQSRSHEKSCLGDFLVTATKSTKKKKKNTSNDEIEKVELDLSNSEMFPEIGARKSTSLRSETRRIKPTNIDKSQKSLSLSSFNTESFQSLPLEENSAFKHQKIQPKESSNSFDVERNMLKKERHKLMEKFNILNTPAKVTPQIRITQKESVEIPVNYVKVDSTKVLMKEKIDLLIEIYDILLKNNLILSINTELYFLISILVSKQNEEEYLDVESKLMDNNIQFLLKSIHNSTYFAVKSLWNQRTVLEVILDKNSLKTLGENKKVRQFTPELAKFILNTYSVRCELPRNNTNNYETTNNCENINFNCETDNADNFPNNQAFHLFKKQRDMFYDIIRWYQATQSGGSRTSFRARVKTLLSGGSAANHAHLATLFIAHMLASCLPSDAQESKLSKLQRRLTAPTTTDSNRLPHFTDNEIFYKEFINYAENESFRVHLKDALSAEILSLDGSHLAVDDRGNSNIDLTKEYLQIAKKLCLLAKFLGYLTTLPYSQIAGESAKNNVINSMRNNNDLFYKAPKEKVLDNNIGLRNYSQPSIDLKSLLENSIKNNRITITLPWIANYLSMLDYTTLRLKYYSELIQNIYEIYKNIQKNDKKLKKNTIIYIKSILGWLFDLPHFPITSDVKTDNIDVESIDFCDLVDESTILELCPCLREINTLLSTCRLNHEQKDMGSFRHITPVSLSVNNEDRIKNKEKELQKRLEEEFVKSQPSSTRRVLELVVERVVSAAVRDLSAALHRARAPITQSGKEALAACRAALAARARAALGALLPTAPKLLYAVAVRKAMSGQAGLAACRAALAARARAALGALLPTAPKLLYAVAVRKAMVALENWLDDHANNTTILCKDMSLEVRSQISVNELNLTPDADTSESAVTPGNVLSEHNISVAEPLIHVKEHICLLLDDEPTNMQTCQLLSVCARTCSLANMFCRAPARKAIMLLTVDLAVVYAAKKPKELNETLLNQLHEVWHTCCPDRKHYAPEDIYLPERRDISPELRNFDEDERMATPISDEEDGKLPINGDVATTQQAMNTPQAISPTLQTFASATSSAQAISFTQQKINPTLQTVSSATISTQAINAQQATNTPHAIKTQQAMNPTLQTVTSTMNSTQTINAQQATNTQAMNTQQAINTQQIKYQSKRVNLQPINTKNRPRSSRSQPASPMLQPLTPKWAQKTSKSQPVSPKLVSKQFSPKLNSSYTKVEEFNEFLECFNRILCPRNILLLSASKCCKSDVWESMAGLLVFLLNNDYLSEDSLTEQCLAVYRQDWPQNILENLSTCMKSVSSKWSRSSTGKFTLFLDFLAEFCGNMDYEPLE